MGLAAGTHSAEEMLITRAPRFAACTMDRAKVLTYWVAAFVDGSPPAVSRGENLEDSWRIEISLAAGAIPENPSGPGWAPMIPATMVPCPSQSVSPSVDWT
ncbi:Uncharacterised protein [Mycobacteroides abscessus subsp. abscessus]|nr:Uncharacterised protein [Mycobacteroides abscessus subsp. abscessus]SKT28361.1 Uncharacterised protein [Mycobacteroides abscessus subsp. abscessus]